MFTKLLTQLRVILGIVAKILSALRQQNVE